MTPAAFASKWSRMDLSERASYQQHFLDLCDLVGHPKPAELDPTGDSFCFERGVEKHGGGDGWADVWKRGMFAFEYKGRHANLAKAYDQLLRYRASLENPPLLVVCDTDVVEIHTNFTGTAERIHRVSTAEIDQPRSLDTLRALFFEPERLRPGVTSTAVTEEAAGKIARLAVALRARGFAPEDVARFLDRIVFCLFAEDVGLLPSKLFSSIVDRTAGDPVRFARLAGQLFQAMAHGGDFGAEEIRHFNGDLFLDAPALELTAAELRVVTEAAALNWAAVDASVFGTLFQRGLDPSTRAALGAEYTSRTDIETLVEPVVLAPLRAEWNGLKSIVGNLLTIGRKQPLLGRRADPPTGLRRRKAVGEANSLKHGFLERLGRVHVLDPACGSGNFLYIALQKLKDLEKEVVLFGGDEGLETSWFPHIGPWQFHGLEVNRYAFELAQMTLWIGYLQWHRGNGYPLTDSPLLRRLENFHHMDALLDLSDPARPRQREWPSVRGDSELYIVGNPPFLGGKMQRRELGDDYVDTLHRVFDGVVPAEADLCCYWFEKARALVEAGRVKRAGLLATQGIRGGANREVLRRIKATGDIFFAVSDRPWILDGAAVHISMIGFDAGGERRRTLDGVEVTTINANLTSAAADLTTARRLQENLGLAFMGDTKVGPFDIPADLARSMLAARNPHGRPNSEVVRPWANGLDVTRAPRGLWIVDFPPGMREAEAMRYEQPYEYVREHVRPLRMGQNSRNKQGIEWFHHERPRPDMRAALDPLPRFLATPRVAKHRLFVWFEHPTLPDCQLIAFARADDFFFGLLTSRIHQLWSLAMGTQLREKESGFRYTPTTCFETFPLPWDPRVAFEALDPDARSQHAAVSAAAAELHQLRSGWLGDRTERGRTLTALYNKRPTWLGEAHRHLDEAVAAAYGWPADLPDAEILARLLALNLAREPVEAER